MDSIGNRWNVTAVDLVRERRAAKAEDDPIVAATTANAGSTHNVGLVLDDDALVRESVATILEELCHHVYQGGDGVEGLRILGEHPDISLVVTDIAMPRLDGIAFADAARQLHPGLRVLFVSGMQRPPPCETFLEKPFPLRALVSAVNQLLEAS
ncbi:MAG TPA: response regulator [Acetobacteraceae bacterium]|nr:response regulator [Acetobacteraceae bacterium]